jgi:hypothetical protein
MAELTSGKVIPRRIDCGSRSSAESTHCGTQREVDVSQAAGNSVA